MISTTIGTVRKALTANDGPAFTYAPDPVEPGHHDRGGFFLYPASTGGVSVVSARRSKDPHRHDDMEAYATALATAGFVAEATYRDGRMITLRVLP